jgi:hypothetical protein
MNGCAICCCCWGKALNPAEAVAMGGPRAPEAGKCLLLDGPKLRLLARFARLESRSPVTSFPPVEDRPCMEAELDIIGDIPTAAGSAWPNTFAKLLSDTNCDVSDWVGKAEPISR